MKTITSPLIVFFCALSLFISLPSHSNNLNKTLLMNVNIIDVENEVVMEGYSLLIEGDRIKSITNIHDALPDDIGLRLNLNGHYVLPGLFDMHVHLATSPSSYDNIADVKRRLSFLAKGGITGVRDMAGDVRQLGYLSRQALLDEITSPNIYYSALMSGISFFDDPRTHSSSRGLTPGEIPWMRAVNEQTDFDLIVAQAAGSGASGIKLYADLESHIARAILEAAEAQQVPTWGHAAVIPVLPHELVSAGIDSVSHATLLAWSSTNEKPKSGKERYTDFEIDLDAPVFKALINDMASKQVFLDPTLTTFKDHKSKHVYSNGIRAAKAAHESGVLFVVGTDSWVDYYGDTPPLIEEMLALNTEVGLTPMETIQAATINSAKLLKINAHTGSIEEGKKADLIVVSGNPLENLNQLKSVKLTYKNGNRIH
ncbi:amidohydrolase family protein [Aestuariibacter salexigens]|uniref:amidohydrolase family protein n=1 Tax=Aestuariibacter salexigens TaxID=226010 RepID=UPI0003FDD4B6|nr:amidohydrolase family protein [Aestuariibacter salexigens]